MKKSQIQALDRTQPGLPLKPGKAGTMTHDYKRHGSAFCSSFHLRRLMAVLLCQIATPLSLLAQAFSKLGAG